MITAVDTNILLDILVPGTPHGDDSEQALTESLRAGAAVVSEAVYAELSANFPAREELGRFLEDTGIRLQPSGAEALHLAGRTWREYTRQGPTSLVYPSCGNVQDVRCAGCGMRLYPRQHVVADFLIGAHATIHADRLLTRDRGYYQTYFSGLQQIKVVDVIVPTKRGVTIRKRCIAQPSKAQAILLQKLHLHLPQRMETHELQCQFHV